MHGLVNRSIQCFLRDAYGEALWAGVAHDAGIPADGFEPMLMYDDRLTDMVLSAAAHRLGKSTDSMFEDLGSSLVAREPLRRLLRFGGADYADFLDSLDELPGRAQLAVPELDLPEIRVAQQAAGIYLVTANDRRAGFGAVFCGLLRAMADDYGALALIEIAAPADDSPAPAHRHRIRIELLDARYALGRAFLLAAPAAGPVTG